MVAKQYTNKDKKITTTKKQQNKNKTKQNNTNTTTTRTTTKNKQKTTKKTKQQQQQQTNKTKTKTKNKQTNQNKNGICTCTSLRQCCFQTWSEPDSFMSKFTTPVYYMAWNTHLLSVVNRRAIDFINHLSQLMRLWYLSHRRPEKAQASLCIRAVSPEPSLFAHMKYGSRQRVRPKIRHLAQMEGCACAFEQLVYGGRNVP